MLYACFRKSMVYSQLPLFVIYVLNFVWLNVVHKVVWSVIMLVRNEVDSCVIRVSYSGVTWVLSAQGRNSEMPPPSFLPNVIFWGPEHGTESKMLGSGVTNA